MTRTFKLPRFKNRALAFVAALALAVSPAFADDMGNPDVVTGVECMEDTAGFGLNCTANDVEIAGIENVNVLDDGCTDLNGDTVTFIADFTVLLNTSARHDLGLWFAQDGGDALTGTCTVMTPAYAEDPPFLDLDGTGDCKEEDKKDCPGEQDTCGDADSFHNILVQTFELTILCADDDKDGFVDLSVCSSWRQPGKNFLCTSPAQAFPGSPSKCKCDPDMNIDIAVPLCLGVDCSDLDDECNVGVCEEQNGEAVCVADPKADSTPCEDGDVCTSETGAVRTPDHCEAGVCTGIPVDCSGLDDSCNDGMCEPSEGVCVADPKPLSTSCEDGDVCTSETGVEDTPDHCDGAGSCVGVPVDCSALDDTCDDGVCNAGTGGGRCCLHVRDRCRGYAGSLRWRRKLRRGAGRLFGSRRPVQRRRLQRGHGSLRGGSETLVDDVRRRRCLHVRDRCRGYAGSLRRRRNLRRDTGRLLGSGRPVQRRCLQRGHRSLRGGSEAAVDVVRRRRCLHVRDGCRGYAGSLRRRRKLRRDTCRLFGSGRHVRGGCLQRGHRSLRGGAEAPVDVVRGR